jgi:hypothetical protein
MMTIESTLLQGLLVGASAVVLASGCGRLIDAEDREGFGSLGADEGADAGDGDDAGGGGGGELSESCYDGVVQPGELCQVQAPAPIDAGIDPCSLTIGDLDGDGRPDLAVPNSDFWLTPGGTHVANVLRGHGNGGFADAQPWAAGEELPVGLALGDFDGDGRVDLATANNDAQQAFLLRNASSGASAGISFAAPEGYPVGGAAGSAAAGDLDGDGLDDLIVTTPSGVTILLGTPAGLIVSETLDLGGTAMHAEIADLDADGRPDLAVVVRSELGGPGRLVLLHGSGEKGGDGSFPEQVEHSLAGEPWWVRAGDLNMDGDLDLVVAEYSADKLSILLGNGLGGFSDRTELSVCRGPQSIAIADFNLDGANDLAITCLDDDRVELWIQAPDGSFELRRWFATGSRPVSVQAADLNLDGVPDLAWANQYGNTVGLVLSQP